eukprot:TRINITY_DN4909_c0_g1_i1.p1 TRINITY_DN4909_c0_g1~~TRINITY_DN4909_c0_g1_i1.p1  ORF type:complete len:246 (-),score=63.76 TRINITY_DN4909_c0_g1_i1:437-1114(-)
MSLHGESGDGSRSRDRQLLRGYHESTYKVSAGGTEKQGIGHVPNQYIEFESETEKGWGDGLMFYTGVTWLGATSAFGLYGLGQGLISKEGRSLKGGLWKNTTLNNVFNKGKRGNNVACGVLVLQLSQGITMWLRGKDDMYDWMPAAAIAGAFAGHYIGRSSSPRFAAAGALVGLTAAGSYALYTDGLAALDGPMRMFEEWWHRKPKDEDEDDTIRPAHLSDEDDD